MPVLLIVLILTFIYSITIVTIVAGVVKNKDRQKAYRKNEQLQSLLEEVSEALKKGR